MNLGKLLVFGAGAYLLLKYLPGRVLPAGLTPGVSDPTEAAKRDLAGRLGVATSAIRVGEATLRQWPDASLGCPAAGAMYSQVITPGWEIVLVVGSDPSTQSAYNYRVSQDGRKVVLCQSAGLH